MLGQLETSPTSQGTPLTLVRGFLDGEEINQLERSKSIAFDINIVLYFQNILIILKLLSRILSIYTLHVISCHLFLSLWQNMQNVKFAIMTFKSFPRLCNYPHYLVLAYLAFIRR